MTTRIALDRYVYEDIYPAFKATTDEKEITAAIGRAFLNHLAERNLVLSGNNPVAVADVGCGPCDTLIKYLTGVKFAPGFTVRATDFLPEYADAERGEGLRILAEAQAKGTIKLSGFSLRAGDAFAGKLLELLSGANEETRMRNAFKIIFASHVMYHADGLAGVRRLITNVADDLLAHDGICIMFHIANTPGTFQEFRARFGSEAGRTSHSDTGAVTIDDPPAQIEQACAARGLLLHQIEFTTRVRFGTLTDDEWRAFKDPRAYDSLAQSAPSAYEDLKRLYFIVQRAPLEFAADRSATGLSTFMDEMRRLLEAGRAALALAERMQVFIRAQAPAALREAIPASLASAAFGSGESPR